jgi:type VI secretion system protein ImpE
VIVQGRYLWAPWSAITRVTSRRPTEIRDRLWLHAEIEFGDDGSVEGFLPARYPDPVEDDHRLGERTDWTCLSGDAYLGAGQKTLMTDNGEFGLLDVRELRFADSGSSQ